MTFSSFDKGTLAIYITGFFCLVTYMISIAVWGI